MRQLKPVIIVVLLFILPAYATQKHAGINKHTTMENKNFTSTIVVDKDMATAFNAIKNFRAWWSEDIEGNTDKLGETFFYHYKDVHLCKLKLTEEVPNQKLTYLVVENRFSFTEDHAEWTNTKLVFELSPEGNKTKITFTHVGLTPQFECYKVCNDAWTNYIQNSLYKLLTTGKGEPNPKDKDGFNAEIVEKWKLKQ